MMALFGETTAGIHLGLLAVNLATIVLLFLLVRDLFDPLAGGIAAASYSLLSLSPSVLGMAAHATHFVNFFGVAATWALAGPAVGTNCLCYFSADSFSERPFLMKQQGSFSVRLRHVGIVSSLCALASLLLAEAPGRMRGFRDSAQSSPLQPRVSGCGVRACLTSSGFGPLVYARGLAQQVSYRAGLDIFCRSCLPIVISNWPLAIAALLGAYLLGSDKYAGNVRWFVMAYFACSFSSVCPGCYFRPHYFIVPLAAVSIFSGVAGSWMIERARRPETNEGIPEDRQRSLLWPVVVLLLMAGAIVIWQQWEFFFSWTPAQACRLVYGLEPFVESPVIAEYVNRHSTPEQQMAVLGSEPQLYFYARRHAATGHLFAYPLTERNPFALKLQQDSVPRNRGGQAGVLGCLR